MTDQTDRERRDYQSALALGWMRDLRGDKMTDRERLADRLTGALPVDCGPEFGDRIPLPMELRDAIVAALRQPPGDARTGREEHRPCEAKASANDLTCRQVSDEYAIWCFACAINEIGELRADGGLSWVAWCAECGCYFDIRMGCPADRDLAQPRHHALPAERGDTREAGPSQEWWGKRSAWLNEEIDTLKARVSALREALEEISRLGHEKWPSAEMVWGAVKGYAKMTEIADEALSSGGDGADAPEGTEESE